MPRPTSFTSHGIPHGGRSGGVSTGSRRDLKRSTSRQILHKRECKMVPIQTPQRRAILEMPMETSSSLQPIVLEPLPASATVSVLITCYNYESFLGQAIESALSQSYPPKEVIVSDDGSLDNSCQIAESYIQRGASVKLLRGNHQGMTGSLNAAFSASSGEIICMLDADDYFLPGKIEAVVSAFRAEPLAGFAVHRAQLIDAHGRRRGVCPLFGSLPHGDCLAATLQNAGVLTGLPPTSSLSLRRQVAQSIFPIPAHFSGHAEQVIHRIAPLATSICAVDRPLSVRRLHARKKSNSACIEADRRKRELNYMRDLWFQQNGYLMARTRELANNLPALESSALYMRTRYIQLKLYGDPSARDCHYAFCSLLETKNSLTTLFWRYSIFLPRSLFQRCINLFETQSIWKEWLGHIARRRREKHA